MTIRKPINALQKQAEKRNENLEGGGVWRVLDFFLSLMLTMLVVFSVRNVLIDPIRVNGISMLETLTDGEIMMVDRLAYAFAKPERGDIVTCYYPDEYYESYGKTYHSRVKRVVATAGDTIETRDGMLYVNGEEQDESYLSAENVATMEIKKQVVPDGCCFVMGDNRTVSIDSRNPAVGPIPYSRVIGKVRMVLYPFRNFRKV